MSIPGPPPIMSVPTSIAVCTSGVGGSLPQEPLEVSVMEEYCDKDLCHCHICGVELDREILRVRESDLREVLCHKLRHRRDVDRVAELRVLQRCGKYIHGDDGRKEIGMGLDLV
jgi:hypothetical protein